MPKDYLLQWRLTIYYQLQSLVGNSISFVLPLMINLPFTVKSFPDLGVNGGQYKMSAFENFAVPKKSSLFKLDIRSQTKKVNRSLLFCCWIGVVYLTDLNQEEKLLLATALCCLATPESDRVKFKRFLSLLTILHFLVVSQFE